MKRIALILAVALIAAGAAGQSLFDPKPKDPESYCQGFNEVLAIMDRSRAHWRALLRQPKMSQVEVLKWIYSRPWRNDDTISTAPRTLDPPAGNPQPGPPAIESADLYLIPGIIKCSVKPDGSINMEMPDFREILPNGH